MTPSNYLPSVSRARHLHRSILKCRFCYSVPTDISPIDISDTYLSSGIVLQCPCDKTNTPYAACILCTQVSSQRRHFKYRHHYLLWYKKHFTSLEHQQTAVLDHDCVVDDSIVTTSDNAVDDDDTSNFEVPSLAIIAAGRFEECKFFNERMSNFYQREHNFPGLGFAHIVQNAFNSIHDASLYSKEEVSFHLNTCRLCVDSTRSQITGIGSLLQEVIKFYAGNLPVESELPSLSYPVKTIMNAYSQRLIQGSLPPLSSQQISTFVETFQALDALDAVSQPFCLNDFSKRVMHNSIPSKRRGIFEGTYPPKDEKDLFRIYLNSDRSIYKNLPCPEVHLTADKGHAYIHLGPLVASFIASGVSSLEMPRADELHGETSHDYTSYYTSPVAKSVYAEVSQIATIHDLKKRLFSIHIKDWGDNAQKNSS